MRKLLWLALLWTPLASAQIVYTTTPGSGYQPLQGAVLKGKVNVRTEGLAAPVDFHIDGTHYWNEHTCPCGMWGDNAMWDTATAAEGAHTIRVVSPTADITVSFVIDNEPTQPAPPAPGATGSVLTWTAPTLNEDGSALTDLSGYRVYRDGAKVADIGLVTSWTATQPGAYYLTAVTSSGAESAPSNTVSVSSEPARTAAPAKPLCYPPNAAETDVGVWEQGGLLAWACETKWSYQLYGLSWRWSEMLDFTGRESREQFDDAWVAAKWREGYPGEDEARKALVNQVRGKLPVRGWVVAKNGTSASRPTYLAPEGNRSSRNNGRVSVGADCDCKALAIESSSLWCSVAGRDNVGTAAVDQLPENTVAVCD